MRRKKNTALDRQKGMALLIFVLMLVVTAGLAMGTWGRDYAVEKRLASEQNVQQRMDEIRDELVRFAMFSPDIYVSDSSGSPSGARQQHLVPPPGYLPCPDTDGDGSPQTGCNGIARGCLPALINSRHIDFASSPLARELSRRTDCASHPYYVVDADFAVKTTFSPLNPGMTPDIRLNGKRYVALLIHPGRDGRFNSENTDGDADFSADGDWVVGIEQSQWKKTVEKRVEHLRKSLLRLNAMTGQSIQGLFWLCGSGSSSGGIWSIFLNAFSFTFDWDGYFDTTGDSVCQ